MLPLECLLAFGGLQLLLILLSCRLLSRAEPRDTARDERFNITIDAHTDETSALEGSDDARRAVLTSSSVGLSVDCVWGTEYS